MPSVIQTIKSDLARLGMPCLRSFLKWYLFPQGSTFPFHFWFRLLQQCKRKKTFKWTIGLPVYFWERRLSYKYGIFANANTEIGDGLRIVHGSGVFINCQSIGENCTIYQNVTLGAAGRNDSPRPGLPIVGNNVTIFTGAVVAGNVILHDGCVIAANAFVNKDVEANTMVGGVPARVIKRW